MNPELPCWCAYEGWRCPRHDIDPLDDEPTPPTKHASQTEESE